MQVATKREDMTDWAAPPDPSLVQALVAAGADMSIQDVKVRHLYRAAHLLELHFMQLPSCLTGSHHLSAACCQDYAGLTGLWVLWHVTYEMRFSPRVSLAHPGPPCPCIIRWLSLYTSTVTSTLSRSLALL